MPTVSTLTFVKTKETNRETQKQENIQRSKGLSCVLDLGKQEKEVDWYKK